MLSAIVKGVKTLFGAGQEGTNNVMKVATGIGGWIDEQRFTDQEKAQYSAETAKQFQEFMNSTIKENTQRSIARRDIALWIIRSWFVMLFSSIVIHIAGYPKQAEYIYKIATIPELLYLVLGVGAFFFGSHLIRQTNMANPKA